MNRIQVLEAIVEELEGYVNGEDIKDKYIKSAFHATYIKYKKDLEDEYHKNALAVVNHKIAHLVKKLT
jgi:ribosomal protein S17E